MTRECMRVEGEGKGWRQKAGVKFRVGAFNRL